MIPDYKEDCEYNRKEVCVTKSQRNEMQTLADSISHIAQYDIESYKMGFVGSPSIDEIQSRVYALAEELGQKILGMRETGTVREDDYWHY